MRDSPPRGLGWWPHVPQLHGDRHTEQGMHGSAAAGSKAGCRGVQCLCSALHFTSPAALLGALMHTSVRACAHMCTHLDTHTCPPRGHYAGNMNKAQLKKMGGTALQRLGGFPCAFFFFFSSALCAGICSTEVEAAPGSAVAALN